MSNADDEHDTSSLDHENHHLQAHRRASVRDLSRDEFPQGCAWAPDGSCLLTCTSHKRLRLYNTAEAWLPNQQSQQNQNNNWKAAWECTAAEAVRSYDWFPAMQSNDPATCCFLVASRDQPVHLYDAYHAGHVRAVYRPYNGLDEMEAPLVAKFDPRDHHIWMAGFGTDRLVQVFDVHRPGRDYLVQYRLGQTRRSKDGQKGLVSALAFGNSSQNNLVAVGTYAPGSLYLYDVRQPRAASSLLLSGYAVVGHGQHSYKRKRRFIMSMDGDDDDHGNATTTTTTNWISQAKQQWLAQKVQTGVTDLQFGAASHTLYSTSRRSNVVLAWDLRMFPSVACRTSWSVVNATNQRLGLALLPAAVSSNTNTDEEENKHTILAVGGQDGRVELYSDESSKSSGSLVGCLSGLGDEVNGLSYTKMGHRHLLAVTTGSRHFDEPNDESAKVPVAGGQLYLYELSV